MEIRKTQKTRKDRQIPLFCCNTQRFQPKNLSNAKVDNTLEIDLYRPNGLKDPLPETVNKRSLLARFVWPTLSKYVTP